MTLIISPDAEEDLMDIYDHGLTQFGHDQGSLYLLEIEQVLLKLAEWPELGRLRTEVSPPVRIYPVGVHIIIYETSKTGDVQVLRVRHSREDWTTNPL